MAAFYVLNHLICRYNLSEEENDNNSSVDQSTKKHIEKKVIILYEKGLFKIKSTPLSMEGKYSIIHHILITLLLLNTEFFCVFELALLHAVPVIDLCLNFIT